MNSGDRNLYSRLRRVALFLALISLCMGRESVAQSLEEALDIGDSGILLVNDPEFPWTVTLDISARGSAGAQSAALRGFDGTSQLQAFMPGPGALSFSVRAISGSLGMSGAPEEQIALLHNGRVVGSEFSQDIAGSYAVLGTNRQWKRVTIVFDEPGGYVFWEHGGIQNGGPNLSSNRVSVSWLDDLHWRAHRPDLGLAESLETANLTWTTDAAAPWTGTNIAAAPGTQRSEIDAAMSPGVASWVETVVEGPGQLRFWWRSSRNGGVTLSVNGSETLVYEHLDLAWRQERVTLEAGVQTVRWRANSDRAFLDAVTLEPSREDIPLDVALDIPGVNIRASGSWVGQSGVIHQNADAARAGNVDSGKNAWIEIEVPTPGTLSFDWRLDSSDPGDSFTRSERIFGNWLDFPSQSPRGVWGSPGDAVYADDFGPVKLRWTFQRGSQPGREGNAYLDNIVYTLPDGRVLWPPDDEGSAGPDAPDGSTTLEEALDIDGSGLVLRAGGAQPWTVETGAVAIAGPDAVASPAGLLAGESGWLEIETPGPGILFYWGSYWQRQQPVLGPHRDLPTIYPSVSINGERSSQGFLSTQWRFELFAHRLEQAGPNSVRWTIEEGAETLDFEDNFLFLDHVTFVPAGGLTDLAGALDASTLPWRTSFDPAWEVALVGADAMKEPYMAYGRTTEEVNLYGAVSRATAVGERAWLETDVAGPGFLSFALSASEDHPIDLWVDERRVASFGEGAHSPETRGIFLPPGPHVARWEAAPTRAIAGVSDVFQNTSLDQVVLEPGPDVAQALASDAGWVTSDGESPWRLETDPETGELELRAGSWLGLDVEGPGLLTFEWRIPASLEETDPLGTEPELWLTDRGLQESLDDAWRRALWRDRSGRPLVENPDDSVLGLGSPQDFLPVYQADGDWVREQIILGSGAHDLRWRFNRNAAGLQKRDLDSLEDRQGRVRRARFEPGIPILIDDPSGLVSVSPDQATYAPGTEVLIEAPSNDDWQFIRWSRDMATTDRSLRITASEPLILRANYGEPVESVGIAPQGLTFASETPTGVFGAPFTEGPRWVRVSGEGLEGGDALKVGPAPEFVEGRLVTSIEGPAVLRFQARLLKETLTGNLTVRVGKDVATTIEAGDGQWRRYEIVVPEGVHPVTWAYTMHLSEAWLDDIEVLDPDEVELPGLRLIAPRRLVVVIDEALDVPLEVRGDPILFDVISTPPGLNVDTKTGRITGSLTEAGSYRIALLASNDKTVAPIFLDVMALENAPRIRAAGLEGNALLAGLEVDPGFHYQIYASEDLKKWRPFGDPITREGVSTLRLPFAFGDQRYFQVTPVPNTAGASARWVSKGDFQRWLVLHSDLGRGATVSLESDDTGVERAREILWRNVDDQPLRLRFNTSQELESMSFNGRALVISSDSGAALGFRIMEDGVALSEGVLAGTQAPRIPLNAPAGGVPGPRLAQLQQGAEDRDVVDSFLDKLLFVEEVETFVRGVRERVDETQSDWTEAVDEAVGAFERFVTEFSRSDTEWALEADSPEPATGYELARSVSVEETGVPVGFEERSLIEMEAKRAKTRKAGVSFNVSVVDADLDPFADYRDAEDREKLIIFEESARKHIAFRMVSTRGHDVTISGKGIHTFQNLDLREGDTVFVFGTYRGRPMETVDGVGRRVREINGVLSIVGEFVLRLQKADTWRRALSGRHWAVEQPTYWKPWNSQSLSLCVDSRPERRLPDLWSEGNHPQARREYFVTSRGPWTVLARDPYNCRCEFIGTSNLEDSIRWRLNFVIQDVDQGGLFQEYTDRVNVTDLVTGETFEWKGWTEGTSSNQPFVPCVE